MSDSKITWYKMRLGDFLQVNPPVRLQRGKKYPFLDMADVGPLSKTTSWPKTKIFNGSGARFENGDTLFARITPCLENGKITQVLNLDSLGFGSTEFYVLRGKEKISDNDFVYYLSRTYRIRKMAEQSMIGASGRQRVERAAFENIEIEIPLDVNYQKRVAKILSAFDDKIELNNKISQNLEQTAQAIFKEWFKNTKNGKEFSLYNLAKYINGGAFKDFINHDKKGLPLIKIAELNRGITDNTEWIDRLIDKKYNINDGDLLFSWSASLGVYIWDKGKAILNQHIFRVEPLGCVGVGFLYFLLVSKINLFRHLAGAKATSMGHIKKENLKMETVFLPENIKLDIFDLIYKKIVILKLENQKLAALRDLLLSKFMSGKIDL